MSLIELMVAFTVLFIIMTGTAAGLTSAMALSRVNRGRSAATGVAAQEMELQRGATFGSHIVGAQPVKTVTVGGQPYTVNVTKSWVGQTTPAGPCEVASIAPLPQAFLRVDVAVTWPLMGAVPPVRTQTTIAPPATHYSPQAAHLIVEVHDRNGVKVPGHLVSLSGGRSIVAPKTTNSAGCAIFPYLKPSTYTASTTSSGYLGSQWTSGAFPTTASATTTLAGGETKTLVLEYDRAGTLNLLLAGPAGGVAPAAVPITLRHARLPGGVAQLAAGGSRAVNVFPFSDAYNVHAGPDLCGAAAYTGPSWSMRPDPGQAVQQRLLATLNLHVRKDSLLGSSPWANQTATFRLTSSCGDSYDVVNTTDGNGIAVFALPYGTWTAYVNQSGSWVGPSTSVGLGTNSTPYSATLVISGLL